MSPLTITIKAWSAWAPGLTHEEDWQQWARGQRDIGGDTPVNAQSIPAMLRRRLSSLGKMALATAIPLLDQPATELDNVEADMPAVLVSRHGDLHRTVTLLTDLAQDEELSPTHFSLSVHNAIGGLLSITRKDPSSITALACGFEDISSALLEAQAILSEQGCAQVLCLIYDEPIPEVYRTHGMPQDELILPSFPYAVAFMLERAPSTSSLQVDLRLCRADAANAGTAEGDEPQALTLMRWLLTDAPQLKLVGLRNTWLWSRPPAAQS